MKIKWYNDFTNKGESDMLSIAQKINKIIIIIIIIII